MKILLVNKFFYPKGGAEIAMLEQARLLQKNGHQVAFFSMHHRQNQYSDHDKFFVSHIDLSQPAYSPKGIKTIGRMIYSFEAKKKFKKMLNDFKPDIVHYHNIYHQISPSILGVAKKMGIPTVMTLHDYKIICPNYLLFSRTAVCERCKVYKYYQPILQKCFKNSRIAGMIIAIESAIHRIMKIYEKNIDIFISPSKFTKEKINSWRPDIGKRIKVLAHFIDTKRFPISQNLGDYIISYGRLEMVKGFDVLLRVMKQLPDIKIKIIGSGSDEEQIKQLAKDMRNVEFIPHLGWTNLIKELQGARLILNLSKFYETFGLTVLEAMALGKVMIATEGGAMEELIDNGKTGVQVGVGNVDDVKNAIQSLYNNENKLLEMGQAAREKVENIYGEESYYLKLMDIYNSLLNDGGEMG